MKPNNLQLPFDDPFSPLLPIDEEYSNITLLYKPTNTHSGSVKVEHKKTYKGTYGFALGYILGPNLILLGEDLAWRKNTMGVLMRQTNNFTEISDRVILNTQNLSERDNEKKDYVPSNWNGFGHVESWLFRFKYIKEKTKTFNEAFRSDQNLKDLLKHVAYIKLFTETDIFSTNGVPGGELEFMLVPSYVLPISKKIGDKTVLMSKEPDFNFLRIEEAWHRKTV